MKTSKIEKLTKALKNGERLTASQIKKRFNISNPSATVSDVRKNGLAIYANKRVAGNNMVVTEYRLGTPTKRVVAAGQRAVRSGQ